MRRPSLRGVARVGVYALVGFAVPALVIVYFRGEPGDESADVADGAVSVDELVRSAEDDSVAVTGFVFVGQHRSILCSARDRDDPPFCAGTSIDLDGLDPTRLDLAVPEDAPAWSRDEVTFLGDYERGRLAVREVLR